MRHRRHPQRVSIGGGFGDEFGTDQPRGAGAVVDYDLLAPQFGQARAKQARDDVGPRADGGGRHHADGFGWIGLFSGVRG